MPSTTTTGTVAETHAYTTCLPLGEVQYEWERAQQGSVTTVVFPPPNEPNFPTDVSSHAQQLGVLRATAIAGNDIASSCLYAAGITLSASGTAAPISTTLIVYVLYLFRGIYAEIGSALPMNGGTYNALLNTTPKWVAALGAVLSMVSYTATTVTSAASAGEYLHYQWGSLPSIALAIVILLLFATLNLFGITESATGAAILFVFHLMTMTVLIVACTVYVIQDGASLLQSNFFAQGPAANPTGNWLSNVWSGYCAALLGITGFETSSNYIEEQQPGVFPKTLRNMWITVSILNPSLLLLALGVLPINSIISNSNYSLAAMAFVVGGEPLKVWIVIDATLVLSGAVLTSYVGIGGLMRRMCDDRLLPRFFSNVNECRKTTHWIIISFCFLTCSLRLLVQDMSTLGGVYAIAFLSVMSLSAASNIALKIKRAGLKRTPIVPTRRVIVALFTVLLGLIGNLLHTAQNAEFFILYFTAFASLVIGFVWRVPILRHLANASEWLFPSLAQLLRDEVQSIRSTKIMFFTKTASACRLNKVVRYVVENEDTKHLLVVHCLRKNEDSVDAEGNLTDTGNEIFLRQLEQSCAFLDTLYPKVTIDLIIVDSPFCPETVEHLSNEYSVAKSFIFITSPSDRFPHHISRFGGLRVISY